MTHKAFNGRVIVEFLADACEMVVSRQLPDGDNRIFGQWLTAKIAQGNREWPYPLDPEFGLATTCLLLDCIALFKKIFHAFLKLIFACWKDNNLVVATSYEYNLRCRNQIWHANLRKSIARWFNLCERNGRYLWLFWVLVCDTVIYISFFLFCCWCVVPRYCVQNPFESGKVYMWISLRSAEAANDLMSSGLLFCKTHLLLTTLSMRTGDWTFMRVLCIEIYEVTV